MTWTNLLILAALVFATDFLLRWSFRSFLLRPGHKAAGIIALLSLFLLGGTRQYDDKKILVYRLLMAATATIFLSLALLLIISQAPFGVAKNHLWTTGFILFCTPFFHFMYGLINPLALSIANDLQTFRSRASISVIIFANMIFSDLVLGVHEAAHFLFFLFASLGLAYLFYLCSMGRKSLTPKDMSLSSGQDFGPAIFFYYLASVMELVFISLALFGYFAEKLRQIFPPDFAILFNHNLGVALYLAVIALAVKVRFYGFSPPSANFYERRLLPASFVIFAVINSAYLF